MFVFCGSQGFVMSSPLIILLVSGKRKSGKDFISEKLYQTIGSERCAVIRLSEPIKSHYAKKKNLDLTELMSDNAYKENYRFEMIVWSDEIRKHDPGYFCKAACEKAECRPFWIVSDIRRKTDIDWFKNCYGNKIRTVRISANDEVRKERGYVFTMGVDNATSECDLDDYTKWDLTVRNNTFEDCDVAVQQILQLLQ